jgi:hypothetical protein
LATSKAKEEYSLENSLLENPKKKMIWPNFSREIFFGGVHFFHIITQFLVLG